MDNETAGEFRQVIHFLGGWLEPDEMKSICDSDNNKSHEPVL